jgi:hypothetical protein
MINAPLFAVLGIILPLSVGEDGEIIDSNGNAVCVVDHNRELPDDRVARISVLISRPVNFVEGDERAI